ncbi:hypothetical protein EV127DRAFT_496521 [Xylaria flabelliformis]|nr:hypothetical protein EV127DRAFT_496521 [Xylaria flabelliformis]
MGICGCEGPSVLTSRRSKNLDYTYFANGASNRAGRRLGSCILFKYAKGSMREVETGVPEMIDPEGSRKDLGTGYGYNTPIAPYQRWCVRVIEHVNNDTKEEHVLLPLFHFAVG